MYHYLDHKEAYQLLRKAGLNHAEIDRLSRFRKHFVVGTTDQSITHHQHLEFIRWLFKTGKLSEHTSS